MALFTGTPRLEFESLPSTNAYAMGLLAESPIEGTTILAYHQSQGKGQRGTTWEVAPGLNLTVSVIYRPTFLAVAQLFLLSKMTALAVAETVSHFLPAAAVAIKWPNDILVGRKKIAGILIETQLEGKQIAYAVIGIGLNINQPLFPPELQHKATSLYMYEGQHFSIQQVYTYLCDRLEAWYLALRRQNGEHLNRAYLQQLFGYQEEIDIQLGDAQMRALLVGVDKGGRLALAIDDELRYFDIKEVKLLL